MPWYCFASKSVGKGNRASGTGILACFRDERDLLFRLAWFITGDEASAAQSVIAGRETALHRPSPVREWLLEWAKWVTIKAAVSIDREAICECEPAYNQVHCSHPDHLLSQSVPSSRKRDLLSHINPRIIFSELDPLPRAILILRTAVNASIFDCVLRLDVSHDALLAANCRAMTWLSEVQLRCTRERQCVHAEADEPANGSSCSRIESRADTGFINQEEV